MMIWFRFSLDSASPVWYIMFTVHQILICEGGDKVSEALKDWRITITLTKEQEDAIMKLRQTDEFCRCSFGEIIRRLIDAGLDESSRNDG